MKVVLNIFFSAQWAFLLAGAVSIDGAATTQLRRGQAKQPAAMIPGVADEKKKKHDKKVMDAISKFRAEICYKMRQEHGKEFASYEACEKFMTDACHPGKDDTMDGDSKEVTSKEGFCKEYFPMARKKAEEVVTHEEELEDEAAHHVGPAPSPFPFPAPAPAPAKKEEAPAPAPAKPAAAGPAPAASAPAPGPMGMPGPAPAPVPAPFIPGISGGKPWGPIGDDEKYYFKKGGKHNDRLHMKEDLKLPAQGYWGKLVEHEDMKTVNADWGREFGPQAGHESYRAICAKNPDNPWCYEQGYSRHHRSSSPAVALPVLSFVCALISMRVF